MRSVVWLTLRWGYRQLIRWIKQMQGVVVQVICEPSGGHERMLVQALVRAQIESQSLGLLQNQFNALQERLDKFGETMTSTLQKSTDSMNTRPDNAAKVVGDLREKVGQIHEVGKAAAELVNFLRAAKLQGGIGEFFLSDLLTQILALFVKYTSIEGFVASYIYGLRSRRLWVRAPPGAIVL